MQSIRNILVPIDFSDESSIGLNAAADLGKRFTARIHLAHFIFPNEDIAAKHPKEEILGHTQTLHRKQLQNARMEASHKLKQLMRDRVPHSLRGHACVVGSSLDELFREFTNESKIDVDLIVAGTSGKKSFTDIFSGSDTEIMIRNSEIPLLAVAESETLSFSNILLATDLSAQHPEKVIRFCRSLSQTGSTLHLGHVITIDTVTPKEAKDRMHKLAKTYDFEGYHIHVEKDKQEMRGIERIIHKANADLLFMKTYPKSPLISFLAGSLAEKAVREIDIPVIIESVTK